MTPTYEDHQLLEHHTAKPQSSSSSSSPPSHVFTNSNSIQDQEGCYQRAPHQLDFQQQACNFASRVGSNDHSTINGENDRGSKFSSWMKQNIGNENQNNDNQSGAAKWMSSKMRWMHRMMMNSDPTGENSTAAAAKSNAHVKLEDVQKQPSSPLENDNSNNSTSNNGNNHPIRVCSDCNTTKTPLWRSGPRGPKSLCNACGIRQRKARRALAAASGTLLATETSSARTKVQQKDKRSKNIGNVVPYKKRSKFATQIASHGRKKLCFEDLLISLRKNLAFHQVFPQDEKEAAILLMALSCGLVHG